MATQVVRRARQVSLVAAVAAGGWVLATVARGVHGAVLLGRRR